MHSFLSCKNGELSKKIIVNKISLKILKQEAFNYKISV